MPNLKVGAAKVNVSFGPDCFPSTEAVGQHDDVTIRVLLLESDRRYAIFSADTPSMFPPDVDYCRALLKELAGVEKEHCWITATHNFASPHVWPIEEDVWDRFFHRLPPALRESEEKLQVAANVNAAFRKAYAEAIAQAAACLQPACVGYGKGRCSININRNMETTEGWWQGVNMAGFADRDLPVVRFNDENGKLIALLYNYSVQPSCCAGEITQEGRLISGDLTGSASRRLEEDFEGAVAIFLPGATNDQVPIYKINYFETDPSGALRTGALGEAGYILAREQGRVLAGTVTETARAITETDPSPAISTCSKEYTCKCQKKEGGRGKRPVRSYHFTPDGETTLEVYAMRIGDIALAGLVPELDGITVAQVRENSPFEKTLVVTFVNGEGKSMPQAEAYPLCQYGLASSPFAEGSAELTRDTALELLRSMI